MAETATEQARSSPAFAGSSGKCRCAETAWTSTKPFSKSPPWPPANCTAIGYGPGAIAFLTGNDLAHEALRPKHLPGRSRSILKNRRRQPDRYPILPCGQVNPTQVQWQAALRGISLYWSFTRCGSEDLAKKNLSLALQGGGSFGAFTWGVLDRLLEQSSIAIDMVSGASIGAVNAVILADGLAEGGPAAARERLARFWTRVSDPSPFGRFGLTSATIAAFELSTRVFSPYQFNPLGLNPLRQILAEEVDFARLRRASPVRLLVAATRVKDGRLRLFRNDEITLDAVLASACLPLLHHAVEIEGESYWDGGYSANPPLRQLVIDSKADDVVVVQITPQKRAGVPHLSPDIVRRANQITFNSLLQKEIEAL